MRPRACFTRGRIDATRGARGQDRGSHSTSSMRAAPAASMARRSKPSAMPAVGGMPWARAARKSSSTSQPCSPVVARRLALASWNRARCSAGVGQFVEGVGEFHAGREQFEAQRGARVGGVAPGQRRLGGGPVGEEGGAVAADGGFDALQQQAEEQVFPGFIRPRRQAGGGGGGVQAGRVALGGQDVQRRCSGGRRRPAMVRRSKGSDEVGAHAAMFDHRGADGADVGLRFIHQAVEGQAGAVPFQHGEFGGVAGGLLSRCARPGPVRRPGPRRRPAAS